MNQDTGADQPQGTPEEQEVQTPVQSPEQTDSPAGESQEATPTSNVEEVSEEEALANAKNPERTKKYIERLKAEAEEAKKAAANPFGLFQRPQEQEQTISPVVDEEGYVDPNALNSAIQQAQQAHQATQRLQREWELQEERRQLSETYSKYPSLDPKSPDFNQSFYEDVQKEMVYDYANGRPINMVSSADKIHKRFVQPEVKKEEAPQGPIESGRGESRKEVAEQDLRSRKDDAAIAERLSRKGVRFDFE